MSDEIIQKITGNGGIARAMGVGASRDEGLAFDYKFELPEGPWRARLVAKSWGKSVNLMCYFEDVETLEKYKISAFRSRKASGYRANDEGIDFSQAGIEGCVYDLVTGKNKRGNPAWLSAKLVKNQA